MPPELLDLIAKGGAALSPIFAFLWWLERSERIALQANLSSLSERTLVLMTELKGLVTGRTPA